MASASTGACYATATRSSSAANGCTSCGSSPRTRRAGAVRDTTKEQAVADPQPLIALSDADLEDLRARLRATRWPTPWPLEGWEAGTDTGELRRLVEYWVTDYDWRAHEVVLNALPSHSADV